MPPSRETTFDYHPHKTQCGNGGNQRGVVVKVGVEGWRRSATGLGASFVWMGKGSLLQLLLSRFSREPGIS